MYDHGHLKSSCLNNVNLTYTDIEISILKFITHDGRPAEIINDAGFKHLVEPLLAKMPDSKAINVKNVWSLLEKVKDLLVNRIKCELKGECE